MNDAEGEDVRATSSSEIRGGAMNSTEGEDARISSNSEVNGICVLVDVSICQPSNMVDTLRIARRRHG